MTHTCPACSKPVGKEDRRFKMPRLVAVNGAILEQRINMAPTLRCRCGRKLILLKGAL